MAGVGEKLLVALERKLGVSRRQVDRRITEEAAANQLSRRLAAISLALKNRVSLNRLASDDELAELRRGATAPQSPIAPPSVSSLRVAGKRPPKSGIKPTKDNSMFVVHGRDVNLNRDMYAFLSSIGIVPMEWDQAIKAAKGGANPIVGDVISQAMARVQGVMVLFSPDEEAKMKAKFASEKEKRKNLHLKGYQPRPNVIFEAGLALGAHSDKTILVQVGDVREISDIAGKHMVHLSNSTSDRRRLADRLASKLKFKIDLTGSVWEEIGDFDRD